MNNSIVQRALAWRAQGEEYLIARAKIFFKHTLAWLEQCEEYFLGRGRQNASRAVHDAMSAHAVCTQLLP